jgi:GNAT superfamily N-acetyltransferase
MTSRITEWSTRDEVKPVLSGLAELLHAAVHAGASVGFVLPFAVADAEGFWRERVLPGIESGERRVLLARWDERIVGTVQLMPAAMPNQRHRAEVAKLLVHPEARRRGIARQLMLDLEPIARQEGRTLLTLDTRTGDAAEPLYLALGYKVAGVIPGYARGPHGPELEATTVMYKVLEP